ncbi:MAG: histidinol-phosphatase HisJ family protein [Clostridia bacterium]|nr:histidinol-phosphatase HisJ family protein [Clostridia bacterium]
MFADNHLHSGFSPDSRAKIERIAEEAVRRGFSAISVTDHCDIDGILSGAYQPYDADGQLQEIERVRALYEGRLEIAYGVEIGQPHLAKEESLRLLSTHPYNIVLGSVHNLEKTPDFYCLPYRTMTKDEFNRLYRAYLSDLKKVALFPGVQVLTHVTYPVRYVSGPLSPVDLSFFRDEYEDLFRTLIRADVALEFNCGGLVLRGESDPPLKLMQWYYDLGGRLVSIGSDAHKIRYFGAGVKKSHTLLREIGFREALCATSKGPMTYPLEENPGRRRKV